MALAKCHKCGCMKQALENLRQALPSLKTKSSENLLAVIESLLKQLDETKYSCLGCEHCYPAVVTNVFNQAFPEIAQVPASTCSFEVREQLWPPVVGEYFVLCNDPDCSVAVSTLASVELAEALACIKPKGLCIVAKTETEKIGIDKIIKNTITNPSIHFLIVAGKDPEGHLSGKTLVTLWENGVDQNMRVKASPSSHPILKNVTLEEVEAFRKQIKILDMIGCEDPAKISKRIESLSRKVKKPCSCKECNILEARPAQISSSPIIVAKKEIKSNLDKEGYFVIAPQPDKKIIIAEHYSLGNKLLRTLKGEDAESIYSTIIQNGWVSQLSHAAYLGKELAKAELSIKNRFKYTQDLDANFQHPK